MKEETTRLSASLEDYLKEIYLLNLEGQEVRITDIARSLGISKPSVNRAMNTLKELELLEHEHYGKITLTDAGRDTAKNILDTNKIVYRFLTEILDVDEQTARTCYDYCCCQYNYEEHAPRVSQVIAAVA